MKAARALITIAGLTIIWAAPALALDPSLDMSQYAHTAWTVREGFSVGATFAMAQTPDGYLWLGSEFGLFRFDGVRAVPWQPPAGQQLPQKPYSLLVTRDGTLWIGTFAGLVSWNGSKLTSYPEIGELFITSLLEDRDGTVWAGTFSSGHGGPYGELCSIKNGNPRCYGQDGTFGTFVWSLSQDHSGALWVAADSGLWKWTPGVPQRYVLPVGMRIADFINSGDDGLLFGISSAGLRQLVGDRVQAYPIHSATIPNTLLSDHDVDSNKLLRDRDGGIWIGTHQRGLIHVHNGRTDVFTKSDGLSGDISCSLFEDREGNVWYGTSRGLDRFGKLAATTISAKQGLSSDSASSVVATTNGSVWIGTHDGVTKWTNGETSIFHKASGLPADYVQSMFEDHRGRLWATFTGRGLWYFDENRFVSVPGLPNEEVYSIAGDNSDNLWLSGNKGLSYVRNGRVIETFPWSAMGRQQQAKVVIPDQGGVWLAFWLEGGVIYFKDGQVRSSYLGKDGLGKGPVAGLRLDDQHALWAATQEGGLSRIKDGRVATLTTANGLPCDTVHWSIEDNDGSLWLYTACGMVRIVRGEVDKWIADPKRRVETTLWDATDGVAMRSTSPAYFNPPVAKAADGKLWFISDEGVQVLDPHNLAVNELPPAVHIEQVLADHKSYWQNLPGAAIAGLRLHPRVRDLTIDYTALSLVAPEKVHFKYKLEGQDSDWREVINDREVQYSNLAPGNYTFRIIASNNSGVWNKQGDTLKFSIAPAYYQTNWFRTLCVMAFLMLLLAAYQYRLRQLQHDFDLSLDARVGERTRIARELHDTLLQKFQGVLPRFQAAIYKLPEEAIDARKTLEAAVDQASAAITEGRDAVQGLRMSATEKNDLAMAIRTIGEELSVAAKVPAPAFEVIVEGTPRDLHPVLRDEVYRIAAEALRNAFQHAHARQIEVEIAYGDKGFTLHVRDNGAGIDPEVLSGDGREGHFGLHGMRERAELAGAKLAIWSKVDSGTELELSIPAAKAYSKSRERDRLFRKSPNPDKDLKVTSKS